MTWKFNPFIEALDEVSDASSVDHNDLSGLQGGASGEYYHLLAAEYTELNAWLDDIVLSDGGAILTTQVATFAQLTLTPRSSALSAVEGGIFYDSDDSSVYVCTEGA